MPKNNAAPKPERGGECKTSTDNQQFHRSAEKSRKKACRYNGGGACQSPISCQCRADAMIGDLADLLERLTDGIAIAAEQLGVPKDWVALFVAMELNERERLTPEQRLARERRPWT